MIKRVSAAIGLLAGLMIFGCVAARSGADGAGPEVTRRVIVVRHAEKGEDGTDDPGLTEGGRAWAEELARFCVSQGVNGVISTPFRRTTQTAWPTARALGLPVRTVPVSRGMEAHVESVAGLIEREGAVGCWLVVGHSNTVPALVKRISGLDPGVSVLDESDYGRVYVLERVGGGWAMRSGVLANGAIGDSPGPGDGV